MSEGAAVSFDLKEVEAVKKMLAKASLSAAARHRLLHGIGVEMGASAQERFDTKQSPDGNSWKALAEKTRKYYAKKKKGAEPPLVVTGFLRVSLTSEVQGGAWAVLVGATKEYAAVHQFGYDKRNIPARPYLGVSPDDGRAIEALVLQFLGGIVR